jgi:4-amino-4-deoxy-L-arabinose transferase-like glycosyltransferase
MDFRKDKKMKNIPKSILILLAISFLIRICLGLITGGADDDAGDYVTYAIQTAHSNNFLNFFDITMGRQVFHLWLFCLVCFMKLFGATNTVAILTTSLIGTLNILLLFKLARLFYTEKNSFYLSTIYSVIPIIIYTSYNPCYETIFIFLFLISIWYYFRFIETNIIKYLIIGGFAGSLLAFIHAYGYPVILVILLSFPFIYKGHYRIKKWILFSLFLLFLPLLQMIIWKIAYNSFYPYLELLTYWASNDWVASTNELVRFASYCLFSLSFFLLAGIVLFIFDLKGLFHKIAGLFLISVLILLFYIFSFKNQNDLFKFFFLIFSISFLILKHPLIKKNALIYLFGVLGLVFFTLMIFRFPARGNPRMLSFVITVLVPVSWYYAEKLVKRNDVIFLIFSSVIGILLVTGLVLNFTKLKDKEIGFVKGKYSSVFEYNIPFSLLHDEDRKIVTWLKHDGVKPEDYIIASINSNRYIPSNLDMAQDHFLSSFFFTYSHKEGFTKQSLENYLKWINEYMPSYIIWDINFQEKEYAQIINTSTGERKIAFDFKEFNARISEKYKITDTITSKIVVYKPLK